MKFRAWDKLLLRMTEPFSIREFAVVVGYASDVEIMQFTGLTDKKGREIYEGDIVKFDIPSSKPFFVKWDAGGFIVDRDDVPTSTEKAHWLKHGHFLAMWHIEGSEIIGNIFENPELLK